MPNAPRVCWGYGEQVERERLRMLEARDERENARYRADYDARRQEWEDRQKAAARNRNIAEAGLYGAGGARGAARDRAPSEDDALGDPLAHGRGRARRDSEDGEEGREGRHRAGSGPDDGLSAAEKARLRREQEREQHEAALLAARKQVVEDRYMQQQPVLGGGGGGERLP
jgi:hypothetical protein